jgi:hypothetical protein
MNTGSAKGRAGARRGALPRPLPARSSRRGENSVPLRRPGITLHTVISRERRAKPARTPVPARDREICYPDLGNSRSDPMPRLQPSAGSRRGEQHRTASAGGPLPRPLPARSSRRGENSIPLRRPGLHSTLSFRGSAARNPPEHPSRRATEKSAIRTWKTVAASRSRGYSHRQDPGGANGIGLASAGRPLPRPLPARSSRRGENPISLQNSESHN